jgi:CO/xanthine dehydrogenase Mo-binding subunit
MTFETNKHGLKVVGTRPIRPDGVEKVTGRANFGADRALPGMLHARIKRSPYAHARIIAIAAEKALALPGVRAVATAADFPEIRPEEAFVGEGPMNFRDLSRNVMARGKVLYEGHAVAAVAAVSPAIAAEALDLIEVEYEVLPHVIDVEEAMADDAPLLHDDLFTAGADPKPEKPSNIAKQVTFSKDDALPPASARPMSSSSGAIRPNRCTRPTSSRTLVSSRRCPMGRCRSGPAARASS